MFLKMIRKMIDSRIHDAKKEFLAQVEARDAIISELTSKIKTLNDRIDTINKNQGVLYEKVSVLHGKQTHTHKLLTDWQIKVANTLNKVLACFK